MRECFGKKYVGSRRFILPLEGGLARLAKLVLEPSECFLSMSEVLSLSLE
jgi:hypothetical protein